jgi:hypothetical protein
MGDDFSFAAPPFDPGDALRRLARGLRDLGLVEREGRFERRGNAIARATVAADAIRAARVRRPARSPEWQERMLRSDADLRDFVADLKKPLALWSDRDD